MTTLALIPARAGSKGIPGKNTRDFAGKPLLAWATSIGRKTCDRVYVSTDAVGISGRTDVIQRPAELATDEAPMLAVVQHALKALLPWRPDIVVLLQPTQPLRTKRHVRDALRMLEEIPNADSVVSVVEVPAAQGPDHMLDVHVGLLYPMEPKRLTLDEMPRRRQDARRAYVRDGTVYAIRRQTIEAGSLYGTAVLALEIPRGESVNLDTEEDWKLAEAMKRGA